MVVPSVVGTVSPVSRPELRDGVVSAFVPAVPVKSGIVSNPAALTTSLLKVLGTALPVSAIVAEATLSFGMATVMLALIKYVEGTVSVMGILTVETVLASNTMVLSALLLVSTVTEVSVVPLAITLFGVVVEVSSVLTPYIKHVVALCVLGGAVLAVIILLLANEPPVASIVVAVPKRLSVEAVVVVSAVELVAAVSLTMSVTPSDEGEGRSDAVGFESSAAVREEKLH